MSSKIFNNLARGAGVASAGVIFALAASPASALTCATVGTTGSVAAKVAVASNFFEPMIDLLGLYTAANSNKVTVCHDSTGVLNTAIKTGTSGYSLFLAANTTTPVALEGTAYVQSGALAQLYAKGIPVVFAPYDASTMNDVRTLVPNATPTNNTYPFSSDITASSLSGYQLDTTAAAMVAVADPGPAPYGLAAFKIMNSMTVLSYPPVPSPLPAWMHDPLYGNIDDTFQSVAGTSPVNQSGFVSKAQVCGGIYPTQNPPTYVYASFSNSAYLLSQSGILIDSKSSAENTVGADIFNYMLTLSGSPWASWNAFLNAHCYASIP